MTGAAKRRGSFDGDGARWMQQVATAARSLRVEAVSTRGTALAGGRPERRPLGRAAIHARCYDREMAGQEPLRWLAGGQRRDRNEGRRCCTRRWQQPGGCERKQQPWADASAGGMPADADDSAQDAAAAAAAAAARRLRPAAAGHGPLILLAGGQRFDRVKGGDASQESFGSGFSAAARGGGSSSEAASYRQPGGCELQTVRLRIRRRCKRRRRQLGGCELQRWAADSTSWRPVLRPRRRLQIDRRRRLRAAPAAIRSLERHEG